jgi:oxygen-independent coproporphyrinogen-3 oxidase
MHLYLHIPFCKQACHYCDFHFSTNLQLKEAIVGSIVKEIELRKDYLKEKKLKTIYFGGGTPSLLSNSNFELIFKSINNNFNTDNIQEITLEANPDDVSSTKIEDWKSFGINRISLGVQSFNDAALKLMNRPHNGKEAENAIKLLLNKDLKKISVDLIYAQVSNINTENADLLKKDLQKIAEFELPHISAYSLTIEDKTVFGNWLKKGKILSLPEEFAANEFEMLVDSLQKMGYEQYEVSNFAKNENYAVHNSAYWLDRPYMGIGPSAHSYNKNTRQANVSNNLKYIKAIAENKNYYEIENLSKFDRANDLLLCGLRTKWGVNLNYIEEILGEIPENFQEKINKYRNLNKLNIENDILTIHPSARIISDALASDLFFT